MDIKQTLLLLYLFILQTYLGYIQHQTSDEYDESDLLKIIQIQICFQNQIQICSEASEKYLTSRRDFCEP